MTAILNALGAGYSVNQVLKYVSKAFPNLAPAIQRAHVAGYAADQILSFITHSVDQEENKHLSGPKRQARNQYLQGQLVQKGVAAAATGLGLGMFGGAQTAAQSTSPNPPQPGPTGAPGVQPPAQGATVQPPDAATPIQTAAGPALAAPSTPVQNLLKRAMPQVQTTIIPQSQQPPVNQVAGNIPQSTQPEQAKVNFGELLNKFKSKEKVDELIKLGNEPDVVAAYINKFYPKLAKKIEKKSKDTLENVIGQYAQETQAAPEFSAQDQKIPSVTQEISSATTEIPSVTQKSEPKPIAKNETVASPQGVGEVKEIRNGKALVEVDGKLHKVDVEDLKQSPIPEKDLADLYDDLIRGIEAETEEDVSRMVQWAGYNPITNTLQFLPHTGKLYTYGDISPEDAALLRDILSVRKTSGENFIGVWKKDSKSPIGAALSKLIKKLQAERGGKGNEYETSYEPIYSAYEPAIQAKKRKKKK